VPIPRSVALALALLAPGCGGVTPQEKAADDARAVAQVEAIQTIKPPVQPLQPEPMSPAVRRIFKLGEAGCEFHSDPRPGAGPVLVAGKVKAVMRIDREPAILAADSGSPVLGSGLHEKYVGRAHWAQLRRAPDSLTIRDRYERIVYRATGTFRCGG
jgi:hypothetical protein